jgi:7,8-dihydroneopterin aldolase/epimerase/oxygenase
MIGSEMDETESAFGSLIERASVAEAGQPADRISVRDYVRAVEIGAYSSERGVAQRLRFNVVLEVAHHAAAQDDDVDQVVSYDTITSGIDGVLSGERLDLLETLAERIAQACLADGRVLRAFVRVEKLDRIPGAFGVEIVRGQIAPGTVRLRAPTLDATDVRPAVDVVFLGKVALASGNAPSWLDRLATCPRPSIVCLGPAMRVPAAGSRNARRSGYLQIEQAALDLADRDSRFEVVSSRAELEWALAEGRHPIWAPARMAEAARGECVPDASRPVALADWLRGKLGGRLIFVGNSPAEGPWPDALPADRPDFLRVLEEKELSV